MKLKKILSLVFASVIFVGMLSVSASGTGFIENFYTDGDKLVILCSDSVSSNGMLSPDQLDITLGGKNAEETEVIGLSSSGIPVTYCCLVDVSGSMNQYQMTDAKDALLNIAEAMGENDNMIIGTLGNSIDLSGTAYDRNTAVDKINSISISGEDTNLYAGIVNGIKWLETNGQVNPKRCLVIISDGMDDMVSGYTRNEAVRAVSDSSIPVYTVAVLSSTKQAENAKSIGEFARLSPGGKHYAPLIDGVSAAEAGADIVSSSRNGFVIKALFSGTELENRDEAVLRIISHCSDGSTAEDSAEVYVKDLSFGVTGDTSAAPAQVSETAEPYPEESAKSLPVLYIIIIAAAAAAAIAALIIIRRRKRSKPQTVPASDNDVAADNGTVLNATQPENLMPETGGERERGALFTVRLIVVGNSDKKIKIALSDGSRITLGRTDKADIVVDPADSMLSEVNSMLIFQNGRIYLRDCGSANGTALNGVPIRSVGRVTVECDDVIRMGNYEYRIVW